MRFYESWDVLWRFGDYPDVVVGFDTQPTQFVFWRGTGFIPMMVNEKQQWYSNEFNETWGRSGGQGCQEPMSDKEAYTNYVRVLENTGARVVVHWRYPLQDVLHVRANYSVFPCWNHWPVTQMPSDGRYASFPDRAAHSSLTHVRLPDYRADHGDRPFQEKTLMEGMTNKSAQQLAVLARSWLSAPELRVVGGCRSGGYQQTERAYHLAAANRSMTFRVMASPDRPLLNPCFEISDWSCSRPATLSIGGRERPAGSSFRQGVVRDSNGRRKMIVWIELEATTPITFTIGGAQPALSTSPTRPLEQGSLQQHADSLLLGQRRLSFRADSGTLSEALGPAIVLDLRRQLGQRLQHAIPFVQTEPA